MSYHIKLAKGRSYYGFGGKIEATEEHPDVYLDDQETAEAAVASGYFKMVGESGEETLTGHLDPKQLSTMKVDDLKKLATDLGIDPTGLKKQELIEAIAAAEVETDGAAKFDAEALAAMSDEELAAFAKEHDIDLDDAKTREEVLEAVSVALGGSYTMLDLMRK